LVSIISIEADEKVLKLATNNKLVVAMMSVKVGGGGNTTNRIPGLNQINFLA
jgi:hypothetical protein